MTLTFDGDDFPFNPGVLRLCDNSHGERIQNLDQVRKCAQLGICIQRVLYEVEKYIQEIIKVVENQTTNIKSKESKGTIEDIQGDVKDIIMHICRGPLSAVRDLGG